MADEEEDTSVVDAESPSWVDESWAKVFFPSGEYDARAVAVMIEDEELREHLRPIAEAADIVLPEEGYLQRDMAPEALSAQRVIAGDAKSFFSLLGHIVQAEEIKEAIAGSAPETKFDIKQARTALSVVASDEFESIEVSPGPVEAVGRTLFMHWLGAQSDDDRRFLQLSLSRDDAAQRTMTNEEIESEKTEFVSQVLNELGIGDD